MVRPLHDYVLVERSSAEEQKGMLFIPEAARDLPTEGLVLAVGDGKKLDNGVTVKPGVRVGEVVVFGKYAGIKLIRDGKEYLLLRESELLGVEEDEKELVH